MQDAPGCPCSCGSLRGSSCPLRSFVVVVAVPMVKSGRSALDWMEDKTYISHVYSVKESHVYQVSLEKKKKKTMMMIGAGDNQIEVVPLQSCVMSFTSNDDYHFGVVSFIPPRTTYMCKAVSGSL